MIKLWVYFLIKVMNIYTIFGILISLIFAILYSIAVYKNSKNILLGSLTIGILIAAFFTETKVWEIVYVSGLISFAISAAVASLLKYLNTDKTKQKNLIVWPHLVVIFGFIISFVLFVLRIFAIAGT